MDRLPADVIREIIKRGSFGLNRLLGLRLVCRRWRQIIKTLGLGVKITRNEQLKTIPNVISQIESLYFEIEVVEEGCVAHLEALPRLKHLTIETGRETFEGKELLRELTRLTALTSLDLSENRNVSSKILGNLHRLPAGLVNLGLGACAAKSFPNLGLLTSLVTFRVTSMALSSSWFLHITALHRLQALQMWASSNVTDECVGALSALTSLLSLDMAGCGVGWGRSLARLSPTLQELDISPWGDDAAEERVSFITHLSNLTSLSLGATRWSLMSSLVSLEVLSVMEPNVDDAGLAALATLTSLRQVTVNDFEPSETRVAAIPSLSSLTSLTLNGPTARNIHVLTSFTSLQELTLYADYTNEAPGPDDEHLSSLSSLPLLTSLSSYCPKITCVSLRHFTQLEELNVMNSTIHPGHLASLSSLHRLTYLSLRRGCEEAVSGTSCLTELTRLPALRVLQLSKRSLNIGEEKANALRLLLPEVELTVAY